MKSFVNQKNTFSSLFTLLLVMFSFQAQAKDSVYTSFFSNVAVSGYDTVAYFTDDKATKGSSQFSTEYKGVKWQFKNAENLAAFKQAPEKYAPQYGGYCAWAVANNDTASGDPQQWTIEDGKLYLNYDASIQAKWLKDKSNLIQQADNNWPAVIR